MVPRDEKLLSATGNRHVQQPPLLVDPARGQAVLMPGDGVGELFAIGDALGVQLGTLN